MTSQPPPSARASTSTGAADAVGSAGSTSADAQRPAAAIQTEPVQKKRLVPFLSPQTASYFLAGGVAGAASRTVVSPLERLKIIQQVQPQGGAQYRGVWASLVRMWREEGFRGFMRGNGINCLRIIPYSAVQFTTYEQLKKWFTGYGTKQLDTPTRLASGALAGITSVCTTYPLDLVRSRLSIATASIPVQPSSASASASSSAMSGRPALSSAFHTSSVAAGATMSANAASAVGPASASKAAGWTATAFSAADLTMWGMTLRVVREEGGVRALYRGLIPTAMGVAPYVGINFATYEALRGVITPPGKSSVGRKLTCGALAGSISQTITYPFDVLRRKMQVTGMGALGYQYNGALDALQSILRTEGVRGLYRGLWPNLRACFTSLVPKKCFLTGLVFFRDTVKVAPSIATSFFVYELVKEFLGVA
ncbi:hypothetical protein EIP86_004896 [Pleurotus ostreatoroseus]|nr:hypothetical protein EIP86_004896 [Pleurotus ostreatoroseus]